MTVTITRKKLLMWAKEHRAEAERLRSQAARLVHAADEIDRKAAYCERDAADMAAASE